ncbi:hypothetical protein PG994_003312 [Apiospora phragmitis]|uniref:Uncharacterized protein n=1 Tax=Apiospora phragmitis TaxID=2905665 RepID=A0ABR1W0U9_9PEZI
MELANRGQSDLLQEMRLVGDILGFVQLGTRLLTSPDGLEMESEPACQGILLSSTRRGHSLASKAISQFRSYESKFRQGFASPVLHGVCRECYSAARLLRNAKVTPAALKELPGLVRLEPEHGDLIMALSAGLASGSDPSTTSTQVRASCLLLSRSDYTPTTDRRPSILSVASSHVSSVSSLSANTSFSSESTYFSPDPYSVSCTSSVSSFSESIIESEAEARRRDAVSERVLDGLAPHSLSYSHSGSEDGADPQHHKTYQNAIDEPTCSFWSWLRDPDDRQESGPSGHAPLRDSETIGGSQVVDGDMKFIDLKFASTPGGSQRLQVVDVYQRILYEVLRQDCRLVPLAFPHAWSIAYCNSLENAAPLNPTTSRSSSSSSRSMKSAAEARQASPGRSPDQFITAVDWLFSQTIIPFRACLLIDGLGEQRPHENDADDPPVANELGRDLVAAAGGWPKVKCCIATEPSPALSAVFEGQPSLPMTELTGPAMRQAVLDRLQLSSSQSHEPYRHRRRGSVQSCVDAKMLHQCASDIVARAGGVFRWTELAVETAVHQDDVEGGVSGGGGVREWRRRIRGLPRHLEDLFRYIIQRAVERHGAQAYRLFRLVAAASIAPEDDWTVPAPLSLLELSFALEDASGQPRPMSPDEIEQRQEAMASRLPELSGGLIRARVHTEQGGDDGADDLRAVSSTDPEITVAFVDDSAAEFFTKSDTLEELTQDGTSTTPNPFSPSLAIVGVIALSLKTDLVPNRRPAIYNGILHARRAEAELGFHPVLNQVTDELMELASWFRLKTDSPQSAKFPGHTTKRSIAARCGLHQYLRHLLIQDTTVPAPSRRTSAQLQPQPQQQQQRRESWSSFSSFCSSSSKSEWSSSSSFPSSFSPTATSS